MIIQFGINDAAIDVWRNPPATKPRVPEAFFRENLLFFIDSLRQHDTRIILMTPNPLRWTPRLRTKKGTGSPPIAC